jgi:hypothetical protein
VEYNPNLGKGRLFAPKTKNIQKPRIPGMHRALFIRTSKDERIRGMNAWKGACPFFFDQRLLYQGVMKLWFKDLV